MKWNNEEITNPNHLARTMILNVLIGLEDQVHKEMFGGLDIRSDIAKRILKEHQNFEVSDFEAEVLLKNISFEINVFGFSVSIRVSLSKEPFLKNASP